MTPDHPTPFELREARLRTFATTSVVPAATAAACLRALHHRQGWDDLDAGAVSSLGQVRCAGSLAGWLQARGHDADVVDNEDYKVDDILWWHAPMEGPARFVICRGEQPGVRVAYWDPRTGKGHWHRLDEGAPGVGGDDQRVRIRYPVPAAPISPLRTGWRAWLFGL